MQDKKYVKKIDDGIYQISESLLKELFCNKAKFMAADICDVESWAEFITGQDILFSSLKCNSFDEASDILMKEYME